MGYQIKTGHETVTVAADRDTAYVLKECTQAELKHLYEDLNVPQIEYVSDKKTK